MVLLFAVTVANTAATYFTHNCVFSPYHRPL